MSQEKREAAGKAIDAEVKKYVDEAYPIVRDRAVKLAPSTIGVVFETRMTEEELKLLIGWLESPTAKKYQSLAVELRNNFSQKLVGDMPVEALVDGCPLYDLAPAAPAAWIYGNRVTL